MNRAPFTGIASDYLPKPDNDPAPVEPGDFKPLDLAEAKAARLAVERYRRSRDFPQPPEAA